MHRTRPNALIKALLEAGMPLVTDVIYGPSRQPLSGPRREKREFGREEVWTERDSWRPRFVDFCPWGSQPLTLPLCSLWHGPLLT